MNFFEKTLNFRRIPQIRRCGDQLTTRPDYFDAPHHVSHVAASRKHTCEEQWIRWGRRISRLQVHAHLLRRKLIRCRVISGNQPDAALDGQGRTRAQAVWPIAMCHLYDPKMIVGIARSIYKPQHIYVIGRMNIPDNVRKDASNGVDDKSFIMLSRRPSWSM